MARITPVAVAATAIAAVLLLAGCGSISAIPSEKTELKQRGFTQVVNVTEATSSYKPSVFWANMGGCRVEVDYYLELDSNQNKPGVIAILLPQGKTTPLAVADPDKASLQTDADFAYCFAKG